MPTANYIIKQGDTASKATSDGNGNNIADTYSTNSVTVKFRTVTTNNASTYTGDGWVAQLCTYIKNSVTTYSNITWASKAGGEGSFFGFRHSTDAVGWRMSKNWSAYCTYNLTTDVFTMRVLYF